MDTLDAAHRIGREYPGGIKALALRMDKNPAVFTQQLNPSITTHHLYLTDAVEIQVLSGRRDIVIAMADELGGVFVPHDDLDEEATVVQGILRTMAEFGDYMRAAEEAMADGHITGTEFRVLEREFTQMMSEAARLQGMFKLMREAARHGH